MALIERLEDIYLWQKARKPVEEIDQSTHIGLPASLEKFWLA